jgi:hypothetical protein
MSDLMLAGGVQLRRLADKVITLSKKGTLLSKRKSKSIVRTKESLYKLFDVLGPRYMQREGGAVSAPTGQVARAKGAPCPRHPALQLKLGAGRGDRVYASAALHQEQAGRQLAYGLDRVRRPVRRRQPPAPLPCARNAPAA